MESQQSMGTTMPSCRSGVGVSEEGQREKLEHVMEHCWKVRNFIHGPFVASE